MWYAMQVTGFLSDSILDWAGTGTQESPLKSQTQELTDVVYSVLVDGQLQLFFDSQNERHYQTQSPLDPLVSMLCGKLRIKLTVWMSPQH